MESQKDLNNKLLYWKRLGDVEEYKAKGANINAQSNEGNSLLHLQILKSPSLDYIDYFINLGVDVNLRNNEGKTALDLVYHKDNLLKKAYSMRILTEAQSIINEKNEDGTVDHNALFVAAATRKLDLAKRLIDLGVDVNAKDPFGWTALHYAATGAQSEDPAIFEILLSAGANVNAKDFKNKTPLHVLTDSDKDGIHRVKSICKIVQVFEKYGADFYAKESKGFTPMEYALKHNKSQDVEALILYGGINVNSQSGSEGNTLLHESILHDDIDTIKVLLKHGANIEALDNNSRTPLQLTIEVSFFERDTFGVLNCLFKYNPDLSVITKDGKNILTIGRVINDISDLDLADIVEDEVWQTILEHLSKLRAIDSPIPSHLLETITNEKKYNDYFEKCENELETAKNMKIYSESWVTPFNLLMDGKKKLIKYAADAEFMQDVINNDEFNVKFPLFGRVIQERFSKAVKRRAVWDNAAKVLCDLLPIDVDPAHRVIINILKFIKFKDLRKLCTENI